MTWLQTPEGVERGVCVCVCVCVWCVHVRLTRLATPSSTGSIRSLTVKNLHREGPRVSPPHSPPQSINRLTSRQWDQGGPDLVEAPSVGRLSPQWCSPWLGRNLWRPHCVCTTHTRCRCLAAGEERGGARKARGGEGRGGEGCTYTEVSFTSTCYQWELLLQLYCLEEVATRLYSGFILYESLVDVYLPSVTLRMCTQWCPGPPFRPRANYFERPRNEANVVIAL